MQTTASVPMCSVLWNNWLAATDKIARSLGMPPKELAEASCKHRGCHFSAKSTFIMQRLSICRSLLILSVYRAVLGQL